MSIASEIAQAARLSVRRAVPLSAWSGLLAAVSIFALAGCSESDPAPVAVGPAATSSPASDSTPATTGEAPETGAADVGNSGQGRPTQAVARAVYEPGEIQGGTIVASGEYTFTFELTNAGDAPLEIRSLDAGNAALEVEIDQQTIEPGGAGTITAVLTPPAWERGDRRYAVKVGTSDGRKKDLPIYVTLEPVLSFEPSMLAFQTMPLGQRHEKLLVFFGPDSEMVIDEVRSTIDSVELTPIPFDELPTVVGIEAPLMLPKILEARAANTGAAGLRVAFPEDHRWGYVTGMTFMNVRMRVVDGGPVVDHPVRVGLSGLLEGNLSARPLRFTIGQVGTGVAIDKRVTLSSADGTPFRILTSELQVTSPSPLSFRVEPDLDEARPSWDLVISGDSGKTGGAIEGQVVLTTSVEDEGTLRIAVWGRVDPGTSGVPSEWIGPER